ncbi:hypothetical protein JW911_03095 [Candidatus Peregrinibacteria bacterium]|nr:hypothetical protein [Candidatus Peregrinibacteria bacterium]
MKELLKKAVLFLLKFLAKVKLFRMRAKIIGVTGSVGKTTCKDAIFAVLSRKYKVLRSEKSYNSEFGLLLTILHQESGFSSAGQWLKTLFFAFFRAFFARDKYDFLVLEMGVDKPGDMDFLTGVVKPDMALITAIKPVHMADGQFKNLEEIYNEKSKIFKALNKGGVALVNLDDPYIAKIADEGKLNLKTYAAKKRAHFMAEKVDQKDFGLEFDAVYNNDRIQIKTALYGDYQVYSLLPAIAAGVIYNVPTEDIQKGVNEFRLPPGRMSLIEGIKDILILDSSYNASPEAVTEALKVLKFFGDKRGGRKIFVFGNMNELGTASKEMHRQTGALIPQYADMLITVGDEAVFAASAANKNNMDSANIFSFKTAKEAADFYKKNSLKNDIVLVKGSQNKVRLEMFIKNIMAHPEQAESLLVRQDENWQNIKP